MFFNQNIPKLALASRISTTQSRYAAPANPSLPMAPLRSNISRSPVATTKLTPPEGDKILVNQRLQRPVAPHLGIYKMDQTWFSHSAWTRITGCTLSGAAYVYFTAYLAAPLLGWHAESASLASAFASMPFLLKGGVKFLLAFPFSYHLINGTRHLVFDLGKGFAKKSFTMAEKLVWSASGVLGLYLAFGV